jgi:hypothetical protein
VTPEEIRALDFGHNAPSKDTKERLHFQMLREIAAQLAEQNQQIRDDRLQRKVWRDEDQALNRKRDEIMAGLADTQAKMGESFGAPPQPVRVEYPGTVQHLACLVREPDGALKLATNTGQLIELDAADTARIVSLMSPSAETEAKPS